MALYQEDYPGALSVPSIFETGLTTQAGSFGAGGRVVSTPQQVAAAMAAGGYTTRVQTSPGVTPTPVKTMTAGLPVAIAAPVIPAVAAALPVVAGAIPALAGVAGVAGAALGVAQALGFGEGGGLFGMNILGGDNFIQGGIPFGGPGLAEPPADMVIKEWHVNYDWGKLQYYLVQMPTGRRKIAMWNSRTGRWKVWAWRTPSLAVIGKNMPSHKNITRLRRNLSKHRADADTLLRLTSPKYAASKARRRHHRH